MHIHIYTRALRALTVVTGLFALLAFVPLVHAQSGAELDAVAISDVSVDEAEGRGVSVSFSLTSQVSQQGIGYGIGLYYDAGEGVMTLADVAVSDESLTLSANESVSRTVTYTPPERLAGEYALAIIARSKTDKTLGEYPLDIHSFEFSGTPVLIDVSSCQFQNLATAGVLRCGIGNMDSEPQTLKASALLRSGGMFGAVVGTAVEQEVTIPGGTVEQIDFSGFQGLNDGVYTAEISFFDADILLAQYSFTERVGAPARIVATTFTSFDSSVLNVTVEHGDPSMSVEVRSSTAGSLCANVATRLGGEQTSVLLPDCPEEEIIVSLVDAGGAVLDTETVTTPARSVAEVVQGNSNTLYTGALILALFLLLGLLVFSRRRATIMTLILLASMGVLTAAPFAWAQGSQEPGVVAAENSPKFAPPSSELESCFDYYRFGSVPVILTSDTTQLIQGAQLHIQGTITNENHYPVDDVAVYAKVFYKRSFEKSSFGPDVIDWFTVTDSLNLKAGETREISYTWNVPPDLEPGDYQLASFVASHDRFNLTGLSFSNDVVGNLFNFSVVGEDRGSVRFNNTQTVLNGSGYHAAIFPARSDTPEEGVPLLAVIENTTNEAFNGTIRWNLYSWDAINQTNHIESPETPITIEAQSRTNVSYVIKNNEHTVYYLIAELLPEAEGDAKSLLTVRYIAPSESNDDAPRLAFMGASSYPGIADETRLYACFHSAGTKPTEDVRVEVTSQSLGFFGRIFAKDGLGAVVYEGTAPGRVSAISVPMLTGSDNFSVTAKLYQGEELVDEVTTTYACDMFLDTCHSTMDILVFIALILILLGLISLVLLRRKGGGGSMPTTPMRQPSEEVIRTNNTV